MKRHHQVLLAVAALLAALVLFFWPRTAAAAPIALGRGAQSLAAESFEARCDRLMHPSIRVAAAPPTYILNNRLSTRVLNNRGTYASASHFIMGMTASHTHADVTLDGPSLLDASGQRECLAPRIEVELSFQPLDVYVAREFPPQSCAYREVFAHEMQHVKLYADNLVRIEAQVRDELARRYDKRPLYADVGQGLASVQRDIDAWLGPMIRGELAKVELLQVQLDGPDETERLSHACMGEVASMMGSSF